MQWSVKYIISTQEELENIINNLLEGIGYQRHNSDFDEYDSNVMQFIKQDEDAIPTFARYHFIVIPRKTRLICKLHRDVGGAHKVDFQSNAVKCEAKTLMKIINERVLANF